MRYRIYMHGHSPIEVYCCKFEIQNNSIFVAWAHGSDSAVDVLLPAPIEIVRDDHARLVWERLTDTPKEYDNL